MEAPGVVPSTIKCHACGNAIDLTGCQPFSHIDCPQCSAISLVPVKFGEFLLLHAMGEGGVGAVYKALDLSLNRFVALKILRKKMATNPEFIENFSREAHAAASINHPNVAQVFSFGTQDSQYYLAMEILEGGSLDDRMAHIGKIPECETLEVAIAAAQGLRAAHQRGLLHRDVKPGNILYNNEGTPKIVDFGLSRPPSNGTKDGGVEPIWGTPYYIAPEKLRGQPEDLQSDIYSLGATLFHAMAGRPPYEGDSAWQVASKHASMPSVSLKSFVPGIHERTAQVIGRMLAKNPVERYAQYDDLIRDLTHALDEARKSETERMIVTAKGERFSMRAAMITGGALVGCLLAGFLAWYFLIRTETPVTVTPLPTGNGTTTTTGVTSEIDFNRRTATGARPDWLVHWDAACLALDLENFDIAVEKLDLAQRTTVDLPLWNRWISFYLGLTRSMDLRGYDPEAARASFLAAINPVIAPRIPKTITTDNFVDTLAGVMVGKIPMNDLWAVRDQMPPWASALTTLCRAVQQQHDHDFAGAARSYADYLSLELDTNDRWSMRLRGIATVLHARNQRAHEAMTELDSLLEKGVEEDIQTWIRDQLANPPLPDLPQAIANRRSKKPRPMDAPPAS